VYVYGSTQRSIQHGYGNYFFIFEASGDHSTRSFSELAGV